MTSVVQWIGLHSALRLTLDGRTRLVSDSALLANPHSGHDKQIALLDGRAWIVWPEPEPSNGNGTPCYALEIDRETGEAERYYLGMADPSRDDEPEQYRPNKADNHCQPQVVRATDGTLHLLLGAHHGRLFYSRSIDADTLAGGWTDWQEIGAAPQKPQWGYTYPALVLSRDGLTLHVVARWSGHRYQMQLVHFPVHLRTMTTGDQSVIVSPPDDAVYAVYYHHLAARSGGELRLNLHPHYRIGDRDAPLQEREAATLISRDGGETWDSAEGDG